MLKAIKKSITWGHDKLTLETGKIARQADGAIIASAMLDAVNSAPTEDPVITVSKFIKGIK